MIAAAPASIPGIRKAAILLVLLGEDVASQIYKHLPQKELEKLTQEIADLDYVDPEMALSILKEYHQLAVTQDYIAVGGTDYAQKLLIKAFGEETAEQLLSQVSRSVAVSANNLDSLKKMDPQQLAKFLEIEHPQTIALILAHLDAKQASALIMKLPEALRAETIKRMAQLRQFSPEITQKISISLHRKFEALGEQSRRAYAGFQGVADLLNRLDPVSSKAILETIEKESAEVALGIRNLMFTFQDLLGVPEAAIRELLGQLDKKTLALALRGAGEELKSYIFKCMSSRAAEMLKEDMEVLGPVRSREVLKAQQEAVAIARKLEEEGKITLGAEAEDEYVL
ncbi:MAG TPA: flagellar motor switch protein FliG [Terriglobales bacterium]|nr:flagellar motor switch protein FliG [Terriglobales bacterium]